AVEAPLEHGEDGLPVDTGRLHPDQGDAEALKPVAQLLELRDRGAEGVRVLRAPAAALARGAHGGTDAVEVHVEGGAALNDHIHLDDLLPRRQDGAVWRGLPITILRFALEAAVNDSAGPRAILLNGLTAPRGCRRQPDDAGILPSRRGRPQAP